MATFRMSGMARGLRSAQLVVRPDVPKENLRERTSRVIPDNIPKEQLLPGVSDLTCQYEQRILPPTETEESQGVYGSLTNGQRISLHLTRDVRDGVSALAGALLRHGALSAQHREMIIVRVGYVEGSVYEIVQHRSLAKSLGVPDEKLDALACREPSGLDAAESALVAFIDQQLEQSRVSDESLALVRQYFTETQIVEAIVVTGNWWMLSRLVDTAGAPLEERRIGTDGVAATIVR